jgi:dipeptidyl aminopeptidase/acylaminoacyl peptidase
MTHICADDLISVRWLSEVDISCDGAFVCVTESRLTKDSGADSTVLVVGTRDGTVKKMPIAVPRARLGRWSPVRAELVLVAEDAGKPQLWLWDVARDSVDVITSERRGVAGACSWSPDGEQVAYHYLDDSPGLPQQDSIFVTAPLYKVDGRPVGFSEPQTGVRISPSRGGEVRTLVPYGGTSVGCAWSPDQAWVAFVSDREVDSGHPGPALWIASTGDGTLRRLSDGVGFVEAPVWSPDSESIAYLGNAARHDHASNRNILLVSVRTGETRSLTAEMDRSFGQCVQSDDPRGYGDASLTWVANKGILCSYPDGGSVSVAWLEVGEPGLTGHIDTIIRGDRVVVSHVAGIAGQIAFVASDPSSPGELFFAAPSGDDERRLTGCNDGWLSSVELAIVTKETVTSADGTLVESWMMTPSPGEEPGKLPLILTVHGGPHWPAGWRFSFENQRLAALGYAVVVSNPRGSQGYGEAFSSAIHADWGRLDAEDVLAVTAHFSRRTSVDAHRIAISGASYGGYLTSLIASRSSLFVAAIAENSVIDLTSLSGTTADNGALIAAELGSTMWQDPELYRRLSPLSYAQAIEIPFLLVHGELDQNCPIGQSEQMYSSLKSLGRDVSFLRLPGEGHGMVLNGSHQHRIERWTVLDAFLATHLGQAAR